MRKKLIEYLPFVMQSTREYRIIFAVEDEEIKLLWDSYRFIFGEQFVESATEYGVRRWEKILKIAPKNTDNLEDRKLAILAIFIEYAPFTFNRLIEMLDFICGKGEFSIERDVAQKILSVKLELKAKLASGAAMRLLRRVAPANMLIDLRLIYNKHKTLAKLTHAQLRIYSHKALRDEVLT